MPLTYGPSFDDAKIYRGKKKQEGDDESRALKELEKILANKRRKQCDCEAQIHDLLDNCLECGRFTCEFEGPGKCFSCEAIVLSQDQRDRLMKYIDFLRPVTGVGPKVNSSKATTRIIDKQFDHFSIDNKKHLREEERARLRMELEELQEKRYKRKLMLQVDVDALEAGSASVPLIDDYEAELKRLQLEDNPLGPMAQTFNLAQLVNSESKNNYKLSYIDPETSIAAKKTSEAGGRGSGIDKTGKPGQPKPGNKGTKGSRNRGKSNNDTKDRRPQAWKGKEDSNRRPQ